MVDIRSTLYAAVGEQMQGESSEYTPETDLFDDLGLDSLDVIEICMMLEEKLGITMDETRLDSITTLGQLEQHLDVLLAEAARAKAASRR